MSIRFKKSKEEALNDIRGRVHGRINYTLTRTMGQSIDMSPIIYNIQTAIADGIEEGFRALLDAQYTDDDFEKDLTLK